MPRPSDWLPDDPRGLREPFAVPRGERGNLFYQPVRTPWLALAIAIAMLAVSLPLTIFTIVQVAAGVVTPLLLAPVLLVLVGSVVGIGIGVARVRWQRRYRRATGRSYPEESDEWKRHVVR